MVNFCAIVGCSNRSNREVSKSFFRLPKVVCNQGQEGKDLSKQRREKWVNAISRIDINLDSQNIRVCSDHFITGRPASLFSTTNPDWVPTLQLGHKKVKFDETLSKERHNRALNRSLTKNVTEREDDAINVSHDNLEQYDIDLAIEKTEQSKCSMAVQTELTVNSVHQMEFELIEKNKIVYNLREQLTKSRHGTLEWFDTDAKVLFYTGLPNIKVLCCVFNLNKPEAKENSNSILTYFQEFTLTLMRMRLNLTINDLGYRFEISKSTASKVFLEWLNIMYTRMKRLISWPARDELVATMPLSFRKLFKTKVAVVIDCFEVFINKPSNLMARTSTWSQYKHHNTIKFLIGISPQGVTTFISKAWGGRVSDKYITENSTFLQNILPGDIVLADRGFDIADSVGFYCGELKIPAFTKGKPQLSSSDVETTRRIASLRIHVERVIGLLRNKYKVLQSILPLDYLYTKDSCVSTIDKLVTVCSALSNVCDSVVPIE